MPFRLRIGQKSDIGNYRENNEDNVAVQKLTEEGRCELVVCLVADGMGGQLAGEKASQMANEVIARELKHGYRDVHNFEQVRELIRKATLRANQEIIELGEYDREYSNMGTTIVLAVWLPQFRDDCLYVSWLGDSRAYLVRDGKIEQLTVDHSIAQALVEAGVISQEEARVHRFRNRLWKYLGTPEVGEGPEVKLVYLRPGDRFLLCTDGLTGVVDDAKLCEVVSQAADPQCCAEELVRLALDCDSKDNVSCVTIFVEEGSQPEASIAAEQVTG
ncbi:MAG: protein phosphatase 2C domain-containing protein [Gemmatales bacterium]|nr:protein phosphatase 2C domain-containing protein [Gemmatales bacterium]MDW8176267.1 protein phosphatase 2C domain-containing protein [Gemmatales bacterium]MDW8223123.1 protein phosphatase 2C domain-containing protein [Gemmatales bacterium]